MNKKNRPMNGQILNGSGQGLRRFKLVNGRRHWIDQPKYEKHLSGNKDFVASPT